MITLGTTVWSEGMAAWVPLGALRLMLFVKGQSVARGVALTQLLDVSHSIPICMRIERSECMA